MMRTVDLYGVSCVAVLDSVAERIGRQCQLPGKHSGLTLNCRVCDNGGGPFFFPRRALKNRPSLFSLFFPQIIFPARTMIKKACKQALRLLAGFTHSLCIGAHPDQDLL